MAAPGFIEGIEANLNYDYRERLGEIACPTLIVWGEARPGRDGAATPSCYERLIPNSRSGDLRGHRAHGDDRAPGGSSTALLEEFLSE